MLAKVEREVVTRGGNTAVIFLEAAATFAQVMFLADCPLLVFAAVFMLEGAFRESAIVCPGEAALCVGTTVLDAVLCVVFLVMLTKRGRAMLEVRADLNMTELLM